MKTSLTKNEQLKVFAFVASISLSVFALYFFKLSAKKVFSSLINTQTEGKVAGTQIEYKDITNRIPIIPNAKITSLDTSNENISVTLESSKSHKEIVKYYEDYMYIHNWKLTEKNTYQKDDRKIKIDVLENIILINLKRI